MALIEKVDNNAFKRWLKSIFCMHRYDVSKAGYYEYEAPAGRRLYFHGRWAVCKLCGYRKFIRG